MIVTLALAALLSPLICCASGELVLERVDRIWDEAPHNAFTDLVRHKDAWVCAFREGAAHVSPDGAIRLIGSADATSWTSLARLTTDNADLRDPKLSITPDGRLMLLAVMALHPPSPVQHQSAVWFSEDGRKWDGPQPVGDPDVWLWRVRWHAAKAHGVGYSTVRPPWFSRLYASSDGALYEAVVPSLDAPGGPTEADLAWLDERTAVCLQRRDGARPSGLVGVAEAPYTHWSWRDLGQRIGGPALLRLDDGRLLAAVRLHDGQVRTSLAWLDPAAGTLTECLPLPSGGDTSYAGMVWHEGRVWVSYYSSHEGKTAIYLARVRVD